MASLRRALAVLNHPAIQLPVPQPPGLACARAFLCVAASVAWVGAAHAALPEVVVEGGLAPAQAEQVRQEVMAGWQAMEVLVPGPVPGARILVRSSQGLPRGTQAHSTPGVVEGRSLEVLEPVGRAALRHEAVHQFLFARCPALSRDALLHEAVAMHVSGELAAWTQDGPYLSEAAALKALARDPQVRSPAGRAALARLLGSGGLPASVQSRLDACAAHAKAPPLQATELLGSLASSSRQVVWVLLSRHSGELLAQQGPVDVPLRPGSTLKPFLVAGQAPLDRQVPANPPPEWLCDLPAHATVSWPTALARSCNGFFLEQPVRQEWFGAYGAVLTQAGMLGQPSSAADAIGLTNTPTISPLGLAQAFRVLAAAAPDVVAAMQTVPVEGTLANLPDSAWAVERRLAMKTGTVRDVSSVPDLGWLVAVDEDVVGVLVTHGKAPRDSLGELRRRWPNPAQEAAWTRVEVQTFSLLEPQDVTFRCGRGHPIRLPAGGPPEVLGAGVHAWSTLAAAAGDRALCLGAPFLVGIPGVKEPRPYAGVFQHVPLEEGTGTRPGTRELRARQGSVTHFTTTRSRYALGVQQAEDAAITGAPRDALLLIVDFNVHHSRHVGRPVCDTTHCQVFPGTPARSNAQLRQVDQLLSQSIHTRAEWLPFSKGGTQPWTQTFTRAQVEAAFHQPVPRVERSGQTMALYRLPLSSLEAALEEEPLRLPCEAFRAALHLPSCPERVTVEGARMVMAGRGSGHGLGLDVEKAKAEPGRTVLEVLRQAYGPDIQVGP